MGTEQNTMNPVTETRKSGGRTRTTAATRLAVALTALTLALLGILVYAKNIKSVVPLGLPVTIIFGVGFYFVLKYLWENAAAAIDRAKNAEQGAGTE